MDRDQLRKELIRDERLELQAYQDSKGFWTIGVGHLLGTTMRMVRITFNEAIALLDYDIDTAITVARSCIPKFDSLNDTRQRALVNMAFNRGGNMKTSTTITPAINKAIDSGNWQLVSSAISSSEWAKQVGTRADRILSMLLLGGMRG